MATLNGINLGAIEEDSTMDSNLLNFPLPGEPSSNSFLIDIMGTGRTMNVSGTYTASTQALVLAWILSIEALMTGNQPGYSYVGEFDTTSKNVCIQSFHWKRVAGQTNSVNWDLTLMEGSM